MPQDPEHLTVNADHTITDNDAGGQTLEAFGKTVTTTSSTPVIIRGGSMRIDVLGGDLDDVDHAGQSGHCFLHHLSGRHIQRVTIFDNKLAPGVDGMLSIDVTSSCVIIIDYQ